MEDVKLMSQYSFLMTLLGPAAKDCTHTHTHTHIYKYMYLQRVTWQGGSVSAAGFTGAALANGAT